MDRTLSLRKIFMQDCKVSVIMGIYNCADTLGEAIDSIIDQTYPDWELIMCDDGSTDNTYQIAHMYQNRYPDKIVLLKKPQSLFLWDLGFRTTSARLKSKSLRKK